MYVIGKTEKLYQEKTWTGIWKTDSTTILINYFCDIKYENIKINVYKRFLSENKESQCLLI
jgi:hypothetical protein